MKRTFLAAVISAAVLAPSDVVLAEDLRAPAVDGWYTTAQSGRGHELFNNYCAECHRPDLTGAMGPALVGAPFWQHWGGQPVETLFNFEHTKMPATNPGSLPSDQVLAITAYILERNALPAGTAPLTEARAKTLVLAKGK